MTDILIADLTQIGALTVISRTSVMQFREPGSRCRKSPGNWASMP
jgi:hypothetical protein